MNLTDYSATMSLLTDALSRIEPHLPEGVYVEVAGMCKQIADRLSNRPNGFDQNPLLLFTPSWQGFAVRTRLRNLPNALGSFVYIVCGIRRTLVNEGTEFLLNVPIVDFQFDKMLTESHDPSNARKYWCIEFKRMHEWVTEQLIERRFVPAGETRRMTRHFWTDNQIIQRVKEFAYELLSMNIVFASISGITLTKNRFSFRVPVGTPNEDDIANCEPDAYVCGMMFAALLDKFVEDTTIDDMIEPTLPSRDLLSAEEQAELLESMRRSAKLQIWQNSSETRLAVFNVFYRSAMNDFNNIQNTLTFNDGQAVRCPFHRGAPTYNVVCHIDEKREFFRKMANAWTMDEELLGPDAPDWDSNCASPGRALGEGDSA